LHDGEVTVEKLRNVGEHQPDFIAFGHSLFFQNLRNGKNGGVELRVSDATMVRNQDGPVGELFNRFLEKQSQINGESPPDSLAAPLTKKDVFFKRPVTTDATRMSFFFPADLLVLEGALWTGKGRDTAQQSAARSAEAQ